ncbi:MAG: glycosyltransferase [Anaerolineae bacterium]|nr:glycosyltransferase [Anaerolineae bacterium]
MKSTLTVIVSPDVVGPVRNGGIGTFVYHFARLLRQHDYRVCILFTGRAENPAGDWQADYERQGIEVIHAYRPYNEKPSPPAVGHWEFIHRGDVIREFLPQDADVIYWQDWQADGFQALRARRFSAQAHPVSVTVLHSSSAWLREGMQRFPDDAEHDLSLDFAERYAARHSDFVVSPSRSMLDWVQEHGWTLPLPERCIVSGYPYLPDEPLPDAAPAAGEKFRRIIFFGRMETRKGFELFVETLLHLQRTRGDTLRGIEEIVLLGKEGQQGHFSGENAALILRHELKRPVAVLNQMETRAAQGYLATHCGDSLVVMPSLQDNFPYAVIETSLIPGLHFICSNVGGIPEILGAADSADYLFAPNMEPFAAALIARLECGPRGGQPGPYDWRAHNQQWLDFHEQVCTERLQRVRLLPVAMQHPRIDVCVPYRNHGQFLPPLLDALDQQTTSHFNLIVVDDDSTDPEAIETFDRMAAHYQHQANWQFVHNARREGLSQTRNFAASLGQAEYLLFVDADNLPARHMIATFGDAIERSGDDCLTCYVRAFEHDPARTVYQFLPLGSSAELGLFMNCFGDANFIVRRQVFEALGGFGIESDGDRYIAGEDHAFLARLVLHGFRLDVVPDFLLDYRYRHDSLFRTTSAYANTLRALRAYHHVLKHAHLEQLIPLVHGLNLRAQQQGSAYRLSDPYWLSWHVPWYVLRDALIHKIRRHMARAPLLHWLFKDQMNT